MLSQNDFELSAVSTSVSISFLGTTIRDEFMQGIRIIFGFSNIYRVNFMQSHLSDIEIIHKINMQGITTPLIFKTPYIINEDN